MADASAASDVSLDWSEGEDVDLNHAPKAGLAELLPFVQLPVVPKTIERTDTPPAAAALPLAEQTGIDYADRAEFASIRSETNARGARSSIFEENQRRNVVQPDASGAQSRREHEVDRLQREFKDVQTAGREQCEEIERLQVSLSEAQRLIKDKEEETRTLQHALLEAHGAVRDEQRAAKLQSELSNSSETIRLQQDSIEQLQQEFSLAQVSAREQAGEITSLRAGLSDALALVQQREGALERLQQELVAANRLAEERGEAADQLRGELAAAQDAAVAREQELLSLRRDLLATQRAAKEHQQQLLASVDTVAAGTQLVASLRLEIQGLRLEAEARARESAVLHKEVAQLRASQAHAAVVPPSTRPCQGEGEACLVKLEHELVAVGGFSQGNGSGGEGDDTGLLSSSAGAADPLGVPRYAPGWGQDALELDGPSSKGLKAGVEPQLGTSAAASLFHSEGQGGHMLGAGESARHVDEIQRLRALLADAETRAASKDAMSASANAARAAAQKLLLAADARAEGLRLRAEELEVRLEEAEQQLARLHGRARGCLPPGGLCRWFLRWHQSEDDLMEPLT